MRLFLAIDLPKEAKRSIAMGLEPLAKEYPYFRWVDESRYHITLHFFGNKSDAGPIEKQLTSAVYDIEPFRMYSSDAGLFIKNSIVLYITFQRSRMLEKLVARVRETYDIFTTQKFVPHLTIARYKIPSKQQYLLIKKKVGRLDLEVEFDVSQITLFNSVIESEKPLYETVAEIPLEKPFP